MPQRPLKKGETSRVVGIRMTRELYDKFTDISEILQSEGFPKASATKSEVMRCVLEQYAEYAKVTFVKKNGKQRAR